MNIEPSSQTPKDVTSLPQARPVAKASKMSQAAAALRKEESIPTLNIASKTINPTASYHIPERRYPEPSGVDTTVSTDDGTQSVHGSAQFLADGDLMNIAPMRFLPTPFQHDIDQSREFLKEVPQFPLSEARKKVMINGIQRSMKAMDGALAVTKEGKHVLQQQAMRACVPATIGMLLLDLGGSPDYNSIVLTNLADDEDALQMIRQAGFRPVITRLPEKGEKRISFLIRRLNKYGPGSIAISAPGIGGHQVVLDAISLDEKTATIRDPFHGWMVTIKLDLFLKLLGTGQNTFIQIKVT